MVTAWADLDEELAIILCYLAECPIETAKIIYYSPSSFSGRLEILANLAKHNMPKGPERDMLSGIFRKLDKLHRTRNSLIHSRLVMHHDFTRKPSRTTVQRVNYRPARDTIFDSFKAQAHDINQHLDTLNAVWQLLHFFCSPWPENSRGTIGYWSSIVLNT